MHGVHGAICGRPSSSRHSAALAGGTHERAGCARSTRPRPDRSRLLKSARMRPLILLALCLLAACDSAPVTGRSQMMLVSEGEERQLGAQAYRQVLASEQQSHDAEFNALVDKVGRRIAAGRRAAAGQHVEGAALTAGNSAPSKITRPTPSACPAARSRSIRGSCRSRAPKRGSPRDRPRGGACTRAPRRRAA